MFFTDINNDIHVWNVHKAIWNFHFKTQIQEHCTTAVDRLPTNGLLFMKSYNARVPNANPPTIFPVWITLRAFVTIPRFTRSIMPSLNISEWIPRSRWFVSLDRTASGIEPIPGHGTQHTQHESVYGCQRGTVVRTSVFNWRSFPDLRLTYGWHVTTLWVRCPL